MSASVGIIDYGMGNLGSVSNAFQAIGVNAKVLDVPSGLQDVTHVVLPGVGAFGDGIRNLTSRGWIPELNDAILQAGKPFLGICLGMQLLADSGTEHGEHYGLGWIPGTVLRLSDSAGTVRIPHIGWNDVIPSRHNGCYIDGFQKPGVYYFVHSYFLSPIDGSVVDGWCQYGGQVFAASISVKNIWAVQFHPEKSQKAGLDILRSFVANCPTAAD